MPIRKNRVVIQIPDDYLSGNGDTLEILLDELETALKDLDHEAVDHEAEIDWRTLDLRIFRDTDIEGQRRDPFLTLRAQVLTREEVR